MDEDDKIKKASTVFPLMPFTTLTKQFWEQIDLFTEFRVAITLTEIINQGLPDLIEKKEKVQQVLVEMFDDVNLDKIYSDQVAGKSTPFNRLEQNDIDSFVLKYVTKQDNSGFPVAKKRDYLVI